VPRQHPIGPYVVDFTCAKARLVIELDGPVHRMDGRQADLARQADLESRGLLVVRFDNDQVLCQLEETLYQLRSLIWSRLVAHEQ
jgi:very-short-patch-repair endonuclease